MRKALYVGLLIGGLVLGWLAWSSGTKATPLYPTNYGIATFTDLPLPGPRD